MKKIINFGSMAIVIAMILSMSVVSCVPEPDGDSDKTPVTPEIVSGIASFGVKISDGILSMYDLTAVIKLDDQVVEETITDTIWNKQIDFDKNHPSKISCHVYGKVKDPFPEISSSLVKISTSYNNSLNITHSDGKGTTLSPSYDAGYTSSTMSISSEKVPEYIEKYPIKDIMKVEYEIK